MTMHAKKVIIEIESLIQFIQKPSTLTPLIRSSMSRQICVIMPDGRQLFHVKSKFGELTEAERKHFLKWGNYTLKLNNDENNNNNKKHNKFIIFDESNKPFSKKGLKRVIKRYFYSMDRPKEKQLAKKRKRERKLIQKIENDKNEERNYDQPPPLKKFKYRHLRSKNLRDLVQNKLDNNANTPSIVLDCRFDSLMQYQDIVSVTLQIRQLYGLNMKAPKPFNIYATSFGGRLKSQFKHKTHNNNNNNNNNDDDNNNNGYHVLDIWKMNFICESMEEYFKTEIESKEKEFIYLTSESENELVNIENNKIYVIGAFVDHNKYKGYTYNLANKNNWKHARLPILKYMKVNENDANASLTRLVITINQVYAILSALYNWNNNWRKALQFALPTRKGFVLKQPLTQNEMQSLVFDGHKIPAESNKYRKGALKYNDNDNHNHNHNKFCEKDENNEDDDLND